MKFLVGTLCLCAVLGATLARPSDDNKIDGLAEENEIPDKKILKKGVSAQWGGYHASAGLGGGPGGGGLYASANAPGSNAGAGIYGSAPSAGAGASSSVDNYGEGPKPQGGDGFFDRIFAIPINILHSVNAYVKSKKGAQPGGPNAEAGAGANADGGAGAVASAGISADSNVRFGGSFEDSASSGSLASASAGAGSVSGGHVKPSHGRPDYDKIFNIPISALKSVNDFLNG